MSQKFLRVAVLLLGLNLLFTGCQPQRPIYFGEDGDLSHYLDQAISIDEPDVEVESMEEVLSALAPLTLRNAKFDEAWDLTLKEAIQRALSTSKVIRSLGGRYASTGDPTRPQLGLTPNLTLSQATSAMTIYRPALQDSSAPSLISSRLTSGRGTEDALSDFDPILSAQVFWEKNDRPQNFVSGAGSPFPTLLAQDTGSYQAQLSKTSAAGTEMALRHTVGYDQTLNSPIRRFISDWNTNIEASVRQPLLQGAGTQYNRIAGPYGPLSGVGTSSFDGVMLARIDSDISLAEFEAAVRDLVRDVENSYWELYFAYRNLEARKVGLESALTTWRRIYSLYRSGLIGGDAADEAQAREQYFLFRAQVEAAKSDLFTAENRLRYITGLSVSDGRLIRPGDEPTQAPPEYNWHENLREALDRSIELRRQKWEVKKSELSYIAAKNHLLPRLDAVGLYRFHGFGDHLINPSSGGKPEFDNAFQTLTDGDFQEWQVGLQFELPIGFRKELSNVRHAQWMITRNKAVLREQERELSQQLGDGIRDLDANYTFMQTNFNRRVAAEKQVEAVQAKYVAGQSTLDLLLQAQRRRADAEAAYFRALVDYNRAIMELERRKGTLLEYNSIVLEEGPWPTKAYQDANNLARQRDASIYLDYGFTRPNVISRGPVLQNGHGEVIEYDGEGIHQEYDETLVPEDVPATNELPNGQQEEQVPAPQPSESGSDSGQPIQARHMETKTNDGSSPWGEMDLRVKATSGATHSGDVQAAAWQTTPIRPQHESKTRHATD